MANITLKNTAVFVLCAFVFIQFIVPRFAQEFLSRCFGNIISFIISYIVAINLKEGKVQVQGKAVLVTGCDTGIGNALARYLDKRGFRVFAGCLDEQGDGARRLSDECSAKLQVIQMDVTSDQQVQEVAQFVQSAVAVSGDVLWSVINNAGIIIYGEIEWLTLDSYKKVTEVNLWGTIRVTKAFLPMIRKCKGRIVNISSMQGRFGSPLLSPYSISKYGIEAFSDSLRYEMFKWGVKTIIIEPGNYGAHTSIGNKDNIRNIVYSVWDDTPDNMKELYGQKYVDTVAASLCTMINRTSAAKLDPLLKATNDALTDVNPHERYFPANFICKIVTWFFCYFPATVTDVVFRLLLLQNPINKT